MTGVIYRANIEDRVRGKFNTHATEGSDENNAHTTWKA